MRFSVVIPIFNKADTILETVRSVLAQSCTDYEIILLDDGSTDNLETALLPVCGNFRLIRQQNAGVSAARNRGIQESSGAYICFLDADDLWLPEHLATLSSAIDGRPDAHFLSTMYRTTYPDGTVKSKLALLPQQPEQMWIENYFDLVLKHSTTFIHTDTVCVHSTILENQRFEVGERIGEDTDLWYRIAAIEPLLLIRKETAIYRRELSTATAGGTNNLEWAFARREMQLMQDPAVTKDKQRSIRLLLDRWRCTCCRQLLLKGDRAGARRYLRMVKYPLQKRCVYCAFLCALPQPLLKRLVKR